jgi:hypothetical protein
LWTDNFQRWFSQLGCQSEIDLIYWDIFLVIQVIVDFSVTIVAFKFVFLFLTQATIFLNNSYSSSNAIKFFLLKIVL